MNSNIQINPYQQNVDIIKGFFRKPIVLVTAILSFLNIGANFLSALFYQIPSINTMENIPMEFRSELITNVKQTPGIDLLSVFFAISFLLFFICSRRSSGNMNVPATMFKVISIIQLVFCCIASAVLLVVVCILSIMVLLPFGFISFLIIPILLIAAVCLLIIGISQCIFANSVKKSIKSIYLYKNGAKLFGITNIIFSVIFLVLYVFLLIILSLSTPVDFNVQSYMFLMVYIIIYTVSSIATGIMAIKYSNYINAKTEQFVTQPPITPVYTNNSETASEPYQGINGVTPVQPYNPHAEPVICQNCGQPVNPDDYFCNNCGTPLQK